MAQKIEAFEIVNHGVQNSQYFSFTGTAFTEWDHVACGTGMNAKEAYEDAVDHLAQMGYDVEKLPKRPRGIRKSDKVPATASYEHYAYIAIYVR